MQRDLAGRLEIGRVAPRQVGLGEVQFLAAYRTTARHSAKLFQKLDQCRGGHRGLDAGRGQERPRLLNPPIEHRAGAVRVALRFPQVQVQPAGELPAEDRVHHAQGIVVGRVPRGADLADGDDRLGRPRFIDQHNPRRLGRRRRGELFGRRLGDGGRPAGEDLLQFRNHFRQRNVAHDDQRGLVGANVRPVEV